jgi:DNA adenine methylase
MNTPWSRDEYDLSYEYAIDPVERARRCIVRYWFTVGANVRNKNGMRFEIDRNTGGFNYFHLKLPDVIAQLSERLKHNKRNLVQIENRSVFELLPKYDRENVLMYLDPPYLLETRKNKKVYKNEFTDDEHEKLLKMIVSSKAKIIISGYMSDLYSKFLSGWRLERASVKDQAGNKKTECIWLNFSDSQENLFLGAV